jgi:hypothetical protein
MENKKASVWKIGILIGCLTGIASIAYSIIMEIFSLFELGWIGNIPSYVISLAGILYSITVFKMKNENQLTLGQGISVGTIASGMSGIIGGAFMYFYMNFFGSKLMDYTFSKMTADLQASGMNAAQIEQAINMSKSWMSSPLMILMGLFGGLLTGAILSLIISLFLKTDKLNNQIEG